jgi:pyruvate-formate lyase-activating enzyme
VAKLYLPPGSRYFGCRHCHNLTYQSCKEHDKRVDALAKLPYKELSKMIDRGC